MQSIWIWPKLIYIQLKPAKNFGSKVSANRVLPPQPNEPLVNSICEAGEVPLKFKFER